MWHLGAGINHRRNKNQNPSHMFSSFLPFPPIASPELTGTDVPLPFQQMPVLPGQLPPVALDQDVGFVSGPTIAFRVCMSGCVYFSSSLSFPDYN